MDTATRVNAAKTAISAGLAVNESRKKYFGVGKVPGGDKVFMQQQMWPVEDLAARDIPAPPSASSPAPVNTSSEDMPMDQAASFNAAYVKGILESLDAS
jgi:hypothetical protein